MNARSLPLLLTSALLLAGCESSTSAADLPRNTFTATVTGDRSFTLSGATELVIPEIVIVVMPSAHTEFTEPDREISVAFPIGPGLSEGVHHIAAGSVQPLDASAVVAVREGAATHRYAATSGAVTVHHHGDRDVTADFSFDAAETGTASPGHVHAEGRFHLY